MDTIKCTLCNREITSDDGYFVVDAHAICEDCAIKTTVYGLYNKSVLRMYNSPDDVIEAEAAVVDTVSADTDSVNVDATPEKVEKNSAISEPTYTPEADEELPQGCFADCPFQPYENCHFYYGELDMCMLGEEGIVPTEEEKAKVREKYPDATPEEVEKFFTSSEPVPVFLHNSNA